MILFPNTDLARHQTFFSPSSTDPLQPAHSTSSQPKPLTEFLFVAISHLSRRPHTARRPSPTKHLRFVRRLADAEYLLELALRPILRPQGCRLRAPPLLGKLLKPCALRGHLRQSLRKPATSLCISCHGEPKLQARWRLAVKVGLGRRLSAILSIDEQVGHKGLFSFIPLAEVQDSWQLKDGQPT